MRMSATENALSLAKDGLMAAAVVTGIANGVQGARLARQGEDGAVPVETGTKPAVETPPEAARIQRSGVRDDHKAISPFTIAALAFAGLNEGARRSPLPTPTS